MELQRQDHLILLQLPPHTNQLTQRQLQQLTVPPMDQLQRLIQLRHHLVQQLLQGLQLTRKLQEREHQLQLGIDQSLRQR